MLEVQIVTGLGVVLLIVLFHWQEHPGLDLKSKSNSLRLSLYFSPTPGVVG